MTDWNQYLPLPRGTYVVDTRTFHSEGAEFVPEGSTVTIGDAEGLQRNPVIARVKEKQLAARLFVGLSVGKKPKYVVEDVIRVTKKVRTFQTGNPGASFLLQKGTWKAGPGDFVDEDSVQIIIIDEHGRSEVEFETEMAELAEVLAQELEQDIVFVDVQVNGVHETTLKVVP